mgnify:CR=1 FL=1
MKLGDKLQVVQNYGGEPMLCFVTGDYLTHRNFSVGDAPEALKYLLLDEEGRKAKDGN